MQGYGSLYKSHVRVAAGRDVSRGVCDQQHAIPRHSPLLQTLHCDNSDMERSFI